MKAKLKRSGGLLQWLSIPGLKYDHATMDFLVGLLRINWKQER